MKKCKKRWICTWLAAVAVVIGCGANARAADAKLPILMYHNLTDTGTTNSMTITQEQFREDMQYLKEYGYTPLFSVDLVNIRAGAEQMPEKPVMITFDDGYESNYLLGFPVLQETGMKATISVITSHIRDNANNGVPTSMTWQELREMYESGLVDIGSHTHMLHNESNNGFEIPGGPDGIQRLPEESWMEYQTRVGQDINMSIRTIQANLGNTVRVRYFSYPFGASDPWFGQILLNSGLLVSTISKPGTADISEGLYGLPRFRMTMDLSASKLLQHAAEAIPASSAIEIDGKQMTIPTYLIAGSNYVKLRDMAALLNGTFSQFSVGWDDGEVTVQTGGGYAPDGSELQPLATQKRTGQSMVGPLLVDGKPVVLAAYNVDGHYYFKLSSLGQTLGFAVQWDEKSHNLVIKTV